MSNNNKALNSNFVSQIVVTSESTDGTVPTGTYDLSGSSYTNGSYTLVPNDLDKNGIKYEITIKYGVISIGNLAFFSCTNLTSIIIPNSVIYIGSSAFEFCTSLTSVTIPDSVTSIGQGAFVDCGGLTSLTIGNSVTSIGIAAFRNCSSLTSVTIPNSVTSIGTSAFLNCTSLTSVTIGNSVTSIGDFAFYGCTSLTSITFNLIDPGTENHTTVNNVSKLPSINLKGESIVYGTDVFLNVPPQEVKYAVRGCTDTSAANYNVNATIEDGSCFLLEYDSTIGRLRIEYRRK